MANTRNAHERLDALLSALEDDVMNGEGILATDVEEMRAEIEELIERHTGRGVSNYSAFTVAGVKDKGTAVKDLMGRLLGVGHRAIRSNAKPRVRMAFSSKRDLSNGGKGTEARRDGGE